MLPIQDHPLRYKLANELHARPFPVLGCPSTAVYLAIKRETEAVHRDREQDRAHLVALLDRYGAAHPQPGATHHSVQIGRHFLKWEQHTEFVTYTVLSDGVGTRAFDPAEFDVFPADWLAKAPGVLMTSIAVRILPRPDNAQINAALAEWFVPESLAVAHLLDDAAVAAGDFRIDPAGHMRFALFVSDGTGQRRIGRIVQRLLEVETYKAMSMLGFARCGAVSGQLAELDSRLTCLMMKMTEEAADEEARLASLLRISAELETLAARTAFRFGATGAYEAIVTQRIEAVREERYEGRQMFVEFMQRRYDPAMRTVRATQARLQTLADRAKRAGDLLRTRVDVERSAQNQALLESMDRRADLALRLQHTVEGLSVVAISYYAVSLASYALYPLAGAFGISKGMLSAMVTVPVVGLVWWLVRRIRKRLH